MACITTYTGRIYPGQCDQMGHMNVLWYTAKFDEASWMFLSLMGVDPAYLRDAGRRMAAVRQTISYLKELFAGDTIIVNSTLDHIGTKSLRFTHRMYRERDSDPVAVCELTGVHLDVSTRRGCQFSAALRGKMSRFLQGEPAASGDTGALGAP
ncbi:MAG TPA: acyl-CoA thioesterase [Steroidobacteraceae bacterium]|nr:acyl-CoA thioesterase [Steroidobacteraceae bacterium]